jgi:hypothetical protein
MNTAALALVCLGIVGFFSILALSNRLDKEAIRKQLRWSSTFGKVIYSESTVKESNPGGESGISVNYAVTKVRFSYTLEDTAYFGEQQWTHSGLSKENRPLAMKYPSGSQVIVYYNEDNPSEAVVECDISRYEGDRCLTNLLGAGLAMSVGLFIIGIILLLVKC